MQAHGPITRKLFVARRDILRGDSLFALLICVVVGIFLVNLMMSILDNVRFQKNVMQEASIENSRSVGTLLAKTAEVLLTTNELSMLRRTILETSLERRFHYCRIVLPRGGVVAASNPGDINELNLPDSWSGDQGDYSEACNGDTVTLTFPLEVRGRGAASLEIVAGLDKVGGTPLELQTAQMAVVCLALAILLLVHRHTRFRLKAMAAIHDGLSAVMEGTRDVSTLELDPQLGSEAVAWNKLLAARQGQQLRKEIEHVKASMQNIGGTDAELAHLCDVLPYGLVLMDREARVIYANGAAAMLLHKDRDQLIHREISCAVDAEKVIQAAQDAGHSCSAKPSVVEMECDSCGISGILRFTIRPKCGTDSSCVMMLIEDITQQRSAEASRKSFLAKAAHELRTPLTNIRIYVENILDHCKGVSTEIANDLNVINNESRRLERSVSEVLSISEIEAGSFALQRDDVRLNEFMTSLRADYEAAAGEKGITLRFELPPKLPVIRADRDKLSFVVHNLLGNALKYTPSGGHVTVGAEVEPGQVTFTFADTGIGIGKEDLLRIFEAFYRAKDSRVTSLTGSGLGLAITREIVNLHGGSISAESELNKGSTFTLTLPIGVEESGNEDPDTTMRRCCGSTA